MRKEVKVKETKIISEYYCDGCGMKIEPSDLFWDCYGCDKTFCEDCKKKNLTYHIPKRKSRLTTVGVHLCKDCMEHKSLYDEYSELSKKSEEKIHEFLVACGRLKK